MTTKSTTQIAALRAAYLSIRRDIISEIRQTIAHADDLAHADLMLIGMTAETYIEEGRGHVSA